jgi:hypothetical protein
LAIARPTRELSVIFEWVPTADRQQVGAGVLRFHPLPEISPEQVAIVARWITTRPRASAMPFVDGIDEQAQEIAALVIGRRPRAGPSRLALSAGRTRPSVSAPAS